MFMKNSFNRLLRRLDPIAGGEERQPKGDLLAKAESLVSTFSQNEEAGIREVREMLDSAYAYDDKKQVIKTLKQKLEEAGNTRALELVKQEAAKLS